MRSVRLRRLGALAGTGPPGGGGAGAAYAVVSTIHNRAEVVRTAETPERARELRTAYALDDADGRAAPFPLPVRHEDGNVPTADELYEIALAAAPHRFGEPEQRAELRARIESNTRHFLDCAMRRRLGQILLGDGGAGPVGVRSGCGQRQPAQTGDARDGDVSQDLTHLANVLS